MRRWIWVAIVVVIGIAAIAMFEDAGELGDRLSGFSWWAFAGACGLALANYAIRFLRWQLYLRNQAVEIPTSSSALVFGSGLSLSITPGKVGELMKSYLLRELHGVPVTKTAPIVVAERVTDLIALLVIAVAGVAAYGIQPTLVAIASALVGFGLLILAWPRPARVIIDLSTRPKLTRRFRVSMHDIYGGLAGLCRPVLLVPATAIAVLAWLCECIGFALIVNAFPDAHVDLGLAMVIYAGTTIAGALSFLPGGLGVTEGAMTIALVQMAQHVDRATAINATLLTRIATLWLALVIGLGFLAAARARVARIARVAALNGPPGSRAPTE
ncbi:MAG: lysylphosphatidylglycerol synthase transmembrane domain-containing protein [Kofleriaceae bacterium]